MSRALARSLVFFTSASVLVVEILAVRLLAPYLGVSLEVFSGVIGVILAGISVGAWLGGRAADRSEPRSLLGPLIVAGGVTSLGAPLVVDAVGPALSTDPLSIVVAAATGFFAPAALLSAVSPVVVKIQLASLTETGRVVGTYSAIGTAGAIVGTFVTGFVLIAAFPTRPVLAVLGSLLVVAGLVVASTRRRWALSSSAVAALLAISLLTFTGPCQRETTYHCAVVAEDPVRETGRTLVLDRIPNSYVDLVDPAHLQFRYVRLIADVIGVFSPPPPAPIHMVSIGGGGFTLPGYVDNTRPGSRNTVLEIDGELVEVVSDQLGLAPDIEVVVGDARISLRQLETGRADVVVGDAYSGASVPWHLTTVEFANDIRRVMAPSGVYVMNVIDYGRLRFVRAETATLLAVFDHVVLLAPADYLAGEAGGNFILVAADLPIPLRALEHRVADRGGTEIGIQGSELEAFVGEAPMLTDDYAPVDQMLGTPGP